MGTRGLIGYRHNNVLKGTYNHSDSYLDGLGQEIIDLTRDIVVNSALVEFKEKLTSVRWVNGDDKPTTEEIAKYREFYDGGVGSKTPEDWYCLLRHAQYIDGIRAIWSGTLDVLIDNTDFLKDGLFCEYAYIFNFDTNCIDIYDGGKVIDESVPFMDRKWGESELLVSIRFEDILIVKDLPKYLKSIGLLKDDEE